MSRKPGIGAGYLETHSEWHMYNDYVFVSQNGFKRSMPRYYKSKIFENRLIDTSNLPSEVQAFYEKVESLKPYHDDPFAYYIESFKHGNDQIFHKSKFNNKL